MRWVIFKVIKCSFLRLLYQMPSVAVKQMTSMAVNQQMTSMTVNQQTTSLAVNQQAADLNAACILHL